jgi:hypothetical protein
MWMRYGVILAIATAVIGIVIGLAWVRYDEWRARREA